MSIITTQTALNLSAVDLQQEKGAEGYVPPALLQFPREVIFTIGQYVATGTTLEAAKNALKFGKVCVQMYYVSKIGSIAKTIDLAKSQVRKWVDDPTDPFRQNYVSNTGEVIYSQRIYCHV